VLGFFAIDVVLVVLVVFLLGQVQRISLIIGFS
jgi:hypothetical protein